MRSYERLLFSILRSDSLPGFCGFVDKRMVEGPCEGEPFEH